MLRCSRCKETKTEDAFSRHSTSSTGYDVYCKACRKVKYQEKKEHRKASGLKYYHEHKRQSRATQMRWQAISRGSPADTAELIYIDEVYNRDRGICQICREPCTLEHATIDHIKSCGRGGEHTMNNVQLAHFLCNQGKYLKERWLPEVKNEQ